MLLAQQDFIRICLSFLFVPFVGGCDLEQFFSERQVSVEESTATSELLFRGVTVAGGATTPGELFTAYFEVKNAYKGNEELSRHETNGNK